MTRIILGLAAVSVIWFIATDTGAQQVGNGGKPEAIGWPREAKGYGKTVDSARRNAVQAAVRDVTAFLRNQEPPIEAWQPDEAFVRSHLLQGDGQPGEDVKLPDLGAVKTWIQPLQESPPMSDMVRLNHAAERQQLSIERQRTAGYGLATLTAMLAAGWAYLRVDESTGGRFSKWIGIGAAALVGLAGLAWLTSN
jgi:hypothetical protein